MYETASATQEKNFQRMKVWRMKNQCLQDEGVDWSSHCMRAFVWDLHTNALIQPIEFHFILMLVTNWGLEVTVSTIGSTFRKD